MTDFEHTTHYRLPDSGEVKTREAILAEYMADPHGTGDFIGAEQALEDAVARGLLVPDPDHA